MMVTITRMTIGAHFPAVRTKSGAEIKNPLPIIEAKGVTVAFHVVEFRSLFERKKAEKKTTNPPTSKLLERDDAIDLNYLVLMLF